MAKHDGVVRKNSINDFYRRKMTETRPCMIVFERILNCYVHTENSGTCLQQSESVILVQLQYIGWCKCMQGIVKPTAMSRSAPYPMQMRARAGQHHIPCR